MKDLGKNPCLRISLWSLRRYIAYIAMTHYAEIQNSRAALFFGIGLGDKQNICLSQKNSNNYQWHVIKYFLGKDIHPTSKTKTQNDT